MAAAENCGLEAHVENKESLEVFETEVPAADDLPRVESSPAIECVLSSSTAPLVESDAPVPTDTVELVRASSPSFATTIGVLSTPATGDRGKKAPPTRRSFTTKFKLECVEHAERTKNKTGTARKFNVDRRRIQEWCSQKDKLLGLPHDQKRGKREGVGGKVEDTLPNDDKVVNTSVLDVVNKELKAAETPLVCSINTLAPDAVIDSVVRGLTASDTLPATMMRLIQDISADLASQDNKATMDSMLRETSMEMLVQMGARASQQEGGNGTKDVSSTDSMKMLVERGASSGESGDGTKDAELVPEPSIEMLVRRAAEVENGAKDSSTAVLVPELQDVSDQLRTEDGMSKPDAMPVNVDVEAMETGELQQQAIAASAEERGVMSPSASIAESPFSTMDVGIQSAILDALMQVATSIQVTANDMLQTLASPTSVSSKMQQPTTTTTSSIVSPKETTALVNPVAVEELMPEDLSSVLPSAGPVVVPKAKTLRDVEEAPVSGSNPVISSATQSMIALRSKVKKYYTIDFKLECVAYAESHSKCAAARHFKVDRRRVQDWCSQKKSLLHIHSMTSVEKMPDESDIEKQLAAVVKEKLGSRKTLTRKMVKDEALRLFREHGNNTYIPSVGWVAKFLIRNNISLVSQPLFNDQLVEAAKHSRSCPSSADT